MGFSALGARISVFGMDS